MSVLLQQALCCARDSAAYVSLCVRHRLPDSCTTAPLSTPTKTWPSKSCLQAAVGGRQSKAAPVGVVAAPCLLRAALGAALGPALER